MAGEGPLLRLAEDNCDLCVSLESLESVLLALNCLLRLIMDTFHSEGISPMSFKVESFEVKDDCLLTTRGFSSPECKVEPDLSSSDS